MIGHEEADRKTGRAMADTKGKQDDGRHIIHVELRICDKDDECEYLDEDDALEELVEHYTGPTVDGFVWSIAKAVVIGALLGILLPVVLAVLFHMIGD